MPVGAAIGGAAVLSTGAQIYGADRAASATRSAANQSNALQRYMYDQNRADQAPYRQIGTAALGQLGALYGIGPDGKPTGQPANFDQFTNSPDYQFAFDQGLNALDRSAASRGRLFSGAQMQGAQRFGQGLASQQYGNYANRLASLAGIGQSATNQLGQYGQNYAGQVGQNNALAANAQASSYMNTANAIGGGINDLAYGYGRMRGGGSGGASGAWPGVTGEWNF